MIAYPKLARNILSIFFGRGFNLLLNFLAISLTARYLGVNNFGMFSAMIAFVFILSKIVEQGFSLIVFRETSRDKNDLTYLNLALTLRLIGFLIVFILYNLLAIILDLSTIEIILTNVLYLNIILSTKVMNIRELLEIPFKVDLRMHVVAIINTIDSLVFLLFVLAMPYVNGGLTYFCIFYVITNLPGFTILLIKLKKVFGFKFHFTLQKTKWLFSESLPLWGFALLNAIFIQGDLLLLKVIHTNFDAGIYGAAVRITMPLGLIPVAIITTVYPLIVQNLKSNKEKNLQIIRFVNKILFLASFTFALLISFKSRELCTILFGDKYVFSSQPLVFLVWAYVFIFYNNFSLDLFTVYKKQKYNILFILLVVVIDLAILFMFIQSYSYNAAGIAKLLSSFIGAILITFILFKLNLNSSLPNLKIILWCAIIAGAAFLLSFLPLVIYILITSVIMITLTFLLKYFSKEEMNFILNFVKKTNGPINI